MDVDDLIPDHAAPAAPRRGRPAKVPMDTAQVAAAQAPRALRSSVRTSIVDCGAKIEADEDEIDGVAAGRPRPRDSAVDDDVGEEDGALSAKTFFMALQQSNSATQSASSRNRRWHPVVGVMLQPSRRHGVLR